MKPAPIPANEADRMADVQAANILNTPREERFDRLTELTKETRQNSLIISQFNVL
jgi:hypothetical protein